MSSEKDVIRSELASEMESKSTNNSLLNDPPTESTPDQRQSPQPQPHPNPADKPPTYSALFFKSPPQVSSQPASASRIAAVMGSPPPPPESSSNKRTLKERWKDLRTSLKPDLRDPGYDSRAKPRTMGKWNVDGTEVGRRKG